MNKALTIDAGLAYAEDMSNRQSRQRAGSKPDWVGIGVVLAAFAIGVTLFLDFKGDVKDRLSRIETRVTEIERHVAWIPHIQSNVADLEQDVKDIQGEVRRIERNVDWIADKTGVPVFGASDERAARLMATKINFKPTAELQPVILARGISIYVLEATVQSKTMRVIYSITGFTHDSVEIEARADGKLPGVAMSGVRFTRSLKRGERAALNQFWNATWIPGNVYIGFVYAKDPKKLEAGQQLVFAVGQLTKSPA